jgi:hypothetical protein
MEFEIMLFCNSIGVCILVLIALFHILGVEDEKHSRYILEE